MVSLVGLGVLLYSSALQVALFIITLGILPLCPPAHRARVFHCINFTLPLRSWLNPFIRLRMVVRGQTTAPSVPTIAHSPIERSIGLSHSHAIVVANHSSLIDFAVVGSIFPNVRFLGRSDQARLPIVGWVLRAVGYVFIEFAEGNIAEKDSVEKALAECKQILRASAPDPAAKVAIFPEGVHHGCMPYRCNLVQYGRANTYPQPFHLCA